MRSVDSPVAIHDDQGAGFASRKAGFANVCKIAVNRRFSGTMQRWFCLLVLLLSVLATQAAFAADPDLPGATANIETIPAGSLVIPMDLPNQNVSGLFNLKAYGAVNKLLQNAVPVKWAIRTDKIKPIGTVTTANPAGTDLYDSGASFTTSAHVGDIVSNATDNGSWGVVTAIVNDTHLVITALTGGDHNDFGVNDSYVIDQIDFSVNADRILPSIVAAGNIRFASGPFIVLPAFAAQAEAILTAFANGVAVYHTTADVDVDIRYTLTQRPFIAISNVNTKIHAAIMTRAGIPGGDVKDIAKNCTPDPLTCNWNQVAPVDLTTNACITINLEPHRKDNDTDRPVNQAAVKAFVEAGGNFFAQCHAVANFEGLVGDPTPVGIFLSTQGIVKNGVNEIVSYPNPTVPVDQYTGALDGGQGGSIPDWTWDGGTFQAGVGGYISAQDTVSTDTYQGAGGKRFPDTKGGNVFYLGGHDYKDANNNSINGVRMVLNSIFVPARRPAQCGFDFATPELTLVKGASPGYFTGSGQTINYTYDVTNTGTVRVACPVTATDDKTTVTCPTDCTGVGNNDNYLDPAETIQCTASYTTTGLDTADITNKATACADGGNTCSNEDSETVNYLTQSLVLVKSATETSYNAVGNVIHYTYVVTNNGQVNLYPPYSLEDDQASDESCDQTPDPLTPGAHFNCTASHTVNQADLDNGSLTNYATAHAKDAASAGNTVDSNQDHVTVTANQNPQLTLVKSVTESSYANIGDVLHYSYVVTNTGNVTLYPPYALADDKSSDEQCDQTPDPLAPGAHFNCTATFTITQQEINDGYVTNTATASAQDAASEGSDVFSNQDQKTVVRASTGVVTFDVYKTWNESNVPADTPVQVHIVCTSGVNLNQTTTIYQAQHGTFTVKSIEDPTNCTVTEIVPPGYKASYYIDDANCNSGSCSDTNSASCFFEDVQEGSHQCDITNTPDPATITITKSWIVEGGDQGYDPNYQIKLRCDDDETIWYNGSSYVGKVVVWGKASSTPKDFEFTIPEPGYPASNCTIIEVNNDNVVKSDMSDCVPKDGYQYNSEGHYDRTKNLVDIEVSAGDEIACEIVNTVFFEGIPTLNRTGMAMLALLMLGLGLVGFRRFV